MWLALRSTTIGTGATLLIALGLLAGTPRAVDSQDRTKRTTPPVEGIVQSLSIRMPSAPTRGKTAVPAGAPSYTGGQEVRGVVTITTAAPAQGARVALASDNTALAPIPPGAFIDAGVTAEEFKFLTKPVLQPTTITLSATGGGQTRTASFVLIPTALLSIQVAPDSGVGGYSLQGVATFTGPPATGTQARVIFLGDGYVSAAPVYLQTAQTAATFTVNTKPIGQRWPMVLRAAYAGDTATAPVMVLPPVLRRVGVCGENCSQSSGFSFVSPGSYDDFSVKLLGAAPNEGAPVKLTSSAPSLVPLPGTLTVPKNDSIARLAIPIPLFKAAQDIAITGSYRNVTKTTRLGVQPPNLRLTDVRFVDRNNNVITRPPDSQPFQICLTAWNSYSGNPYAQLPPTVVRIKYTKSTGTGRTVELPVASSSDNSQKLCSAIEGLEVGQYHDVEVTIDPVNAIVEQTEADNVVKTRIER